MSIFVDVVTYSGWAASILSTGYIGVQHMQARRDKKQMEHLAALLTRLSDQGASVERPVSVAHANLPLPRQWRIGSGLH